MPVDRETQKTNIARTVLSLGEGLECYYLDPTAFMPEISKAAEHIVKNYLKGDETKFEERLERIPENFFAYIDAFKERGIRNERSLVTALLRNPIILAYFKEEASAVVARLDETTEILTRKQFGLEKKDVLNLFVENSRYLTYLPSTIEDTIISGLAHMASPFVRFSGDSEILSNPALFQKSRLNHVLENGKSVSEYLLRMLRCEFMSPDRYGGRPINASTPFYVAPSDSFHLNNRASREQEVVTQLGLSCLSTAKTLPTGEKGGKYKNMIVVPQAPEGREVADEKKVLQNAIKGFLAATREYFYAHAGAWPTHPVDWRPGRSVMALFTLDRSPMPPKTLEEREHLARGLVVSGLLTSYGLMSSKNHSAPGL